MSDYNLRTIIENHGKLLVNIYGKSATGKTTLALHLLNIFKPSLYVQASEIFPKRRFCSIHGSKSLQKIFVLPRNTCSKYSQLTATLKKLATPEDMRFPYDLKCIVIDNISHHLRYEISRIKDIQKTSKILDSFFSEVFFPLVMHCRREGIYLILIHEASFNPHAQKITHFNKVFSRIEALNIKLEKDLFTGQSKMEISFDDQLYCQPYKIAKKGIVLG